MKGGKIITGLMSASIIKLDGVPHIISITKDISRQKEIEKEKENLISELRTALSEVRTLQGFIPICANCKNIRDDQGFWKRIEAYIQENSEVELSHSICPECAKKLYPDLVIHQD